MPITPILPTYALECDHCGECALGELAALRSAGWCDYVKPRSHSIPGPVQLLCPRCARAVLDALAGRLVVVRVEVPLAQPMRVTHVSASCPRCATPLAEMDGCWTCPRCDP